MGCLRNIIRAIIFTLAIIGFLSIGGKELVTKWIKTWSDFSQETIIEKAQKVGDFSKLNEEFEIEKATGFLGYNAVVAEHKSTGQKMIIVDSGKKSLITADDLKADNIEEKLKNSIKKIKYQAISVEDLSITKKGTLTAYGKTGPYVRFEAKLKKFPVNNISGIVSVVNDAKGQEKLLISVTEKNKYSHLIAEEFFKNIK